MEKKCDCNKINRMKELLAERDIKKRDDVYFLNTIEEIEDDLKTRTVGEIVESMYWIQDILHGLMDVIFEEEVPNEDQ